MAEQFPLDPAALMRDLVSRWEKGLNEIANRTMASDEFNRGMHGAMGVSLAAQKSLGELLGRTASSLNLPTRDDVSALGDRLQTIEERLIRIESALGHVAGAAAPGVAAAPPKPRRTRRPALQQPQQAAQPQPSAAPRSPARPQSSAKPPQPAPQRTRKGQP